MPLPLAPEHCAVVVVNYNGSVDALACLAALARLVNAPCRIVLVDNGSAPGEIGHLLEGWSAIAMANEQPAPIVCHDGEPLFDAPLLLLALPENQGFSGGNNAALRLLLTLPDCHAFWLLNSDTEPEPSALNALCARLNRQLEAGICGSTLILGRSPGYLQCAAGGTFTPWLAATRHLGEGQHMASLPAVEEVERDLDYINGASLLVRCELLQKIGLLSEEYFLYSEDVDFCLRARQVDVGLTWAPDSIVLHHEGGSSGAHSGGGHRPMRSRLVDYLCVRNRFHLVRKFHPFALPVALFSLPLIFANRLHRGQADRCGLLLRAVCDALTGRMGRPGGPL